MSVEDIIFDKLKNTAEVTSTDAAHLTETVRKEAYTEQRSHSEDADSGRFHTWIAEICAYISVMERTRENYAFRYLYSCRKWLGGIIVFFKRVVRKLLKWYIEPICFQQTEFNNAVTPSIGRLTECTGYLSQRTEELQNLASENAENTRVLEERTGEALRQLAEENHALHNSLNEMSAAFQELKAMLVLNQTGLEELKDDMDCVRETDASIFEHSQKSFFDKKTCSQSGEDSIIAYILMVLGYHPDEITYLDLGANHAQELSNTYYFYSKGAHGVLVEANPALIPELKLLRHRDTILNYCVTDHDDDVVAFYISSGDGLSTSDYESAQAALATNANLSISGTEKIKTITIKRILEDYMKTAPTLLNIDIEGCEMAVLTDYDFANYRPTVICVEMIPYETGLVIEKKNSEVADLLKEKGYVEYAFTGINSIFIDRSKLNGGNKS